MSKGINAWAKELKHNEDFAKKYLGVKTVQDIINVAKRQGYDINAKELKELDLDAVAGGFGGPKAELDIKTAVAAMAQTAIASGSGATAAATGNQIIEQQHD